WREFGEPLVVRRLERERSLSGDEGAAARDGLAVEVDAQHEQPPEQARGSRHLLEIAARGFRMRQGGTGRALPAARLDPQASLPPPPHSAPGPQQEVLPAAPPAQPPLLAAQPAPQVPRYRGPGIAAGGARLAPQAAGEGLGRLARHSELVRQIDEQLVQRTV